MELNATTLHRRVKDKLARDSHRYTKHRRRVVELLFEAGRPVTLPELLAADPKLPQSSIYRILDVLCRADLVARIDSAGHSHFELAEHLIGHHHHFVCDVCGVMKDFSLDAEFEEALDRVLAESARKGGFDPRDHKLDLTGKCADCVSEAPG